MSGEGRTSHLVLAPAAGALPLPRNAKWLKYRYTLVLETVGAELGRVALSVATLALDINSATKSRRLANISLSLFGKSALFSIHCLTFCQRCIGRRILYLEVEDSAECIGQMCGEVVNSGLENCNVAALPNISNDIGGSLDRADRGGAGLENCHAESLSIVGRASMVAADGRDSKSRPDAVGGGA